MDINGRGQVVGGQAGHAALWQDGTLTDLGSLTGPGGESGALALNDAGQVVGASGGRAVLITPEDTNQDGAPDRWYRDDDRNGVNDLMTALGAFVGESSAHDINAAGQVVGESGGRAVLWRNGDMIDLGSLAASDTQMAALGINDAGQVVGRSGDFAFLLNPEDSDGDGVPDRWYRDSNNDGGNDLMVRLGQHDGRAAAVNAGGQVVGDDATGGFLWTPAVPTGTAGTLAYLDSTFYVEDLNASAQVVGNRFAGSDEYGSYFWASLWENGAPHGLGLLIPPDSGWSSLDMVWGINDDGRIVGWGDGGGYLLVPTGEPPAIAISDATATEGNAGTRLMTFDVTLSAASGQPVTIDFATADGSAVAAGDYRPASGTLTFAPGERSKTITVLVNGDRLLEPNETFSVNLSGATNATIADGQGVGTILDDEPRISISDVTKYEGKKGQTTLFVFTVTLSAAYDQPVTMSFRTANGTANTSDNDYVARTGTLTFAPGETTKTITIEVKGDSKREADEVFYLDLFGNSGNALFTKSRGTGTILNDD
jgi:probable HAF family extracellular repeat protein